MMEILFAKFCNCKPARQIVLVKLNYENGGTKHILTVAVFIRLYLFLICNTYLTAVHHTINRAAFVCLSVCLSVCLFVRFSPPRSFDRSSPNLVGVCRWTSELPLRGSFSKRLTGRWVNGSLSLSTILYMCQPHSTQYTPSQRETTTIACSITPLPPWIYFTSENSIWRSAKPKPL